jgi:hypothetical protein
VQLVFCTNGYWQDALFCISNGVWWRSLVVAGYEMLCQKNFVQIQRPTILNVLLKIVF